MFHRTPHDFSFLLRETPNSPRSYGTSLRSKRTDRHALESSRQIVVSCPFIAPFSSLLVSIHRSEGNPRDGRFADIGPFLLIYCETDLFGVFVDSSSSLHSSRSLLSVSPCPIRPPSTFPNSVHSLSRPRQSLLRVIY